jgi:hypothetical protein
LDKDEDEEAVVNDENEHDIGEQDNGKHNKSSEEAEAEADKRVNKEHESEEDLLEDIREKEEQEGEGQQEAVREGEREGEEKTGDKIESYSKTREKDYTVYNSEEEEHRGDGEAGKEQGD